jgi:ribosomal protein S27E
MEDADLRLDGNAAGGLLGEVFAWEATAARGTCASCGAVGEVAALVVYAHAPGTVLRCPACGSVLLRIVRSADRLWLDARGLSCLELRAPA